MADHDSFRTSRAQAFRLSMGHVLSCGQQHHTFMIRPRLVKGQTCSSQLEVVAGAEVVPSMCDDASGVSVSCIAALRCFLAFFLAALLICNTCSQFKKGHC